MMVSIITDSSVGSKRTQEVIETIEKAIINSDGIWYEGGRSTWESAYKGGLVGGICIFLLSEGDWLEEIAKLRWVLLKELSLSEEQIILSGQVSPRRRRTRRRSTRQV